MKKRLLMIAFHYPPCGESSGLQRTLAFTKYLRNYAWEPALVTVWPRAYSVTSDSQMREIPEAMPILRPPVLDAARHLAFRGRYPSFLALPDRWSSWNLTGLRSALKLAREFQPDAIWSTFPIATAHRIAARLAERTGLPWIADMRDPMVEHDRVSNQWFPMDPAIRNARLEVERCAITESSRVIFCTNGARDICIERYGADAAKKCAIVPNGYDEAAFLRAEAELQTSAGNQRAAFRMLHSGTVYPGTDRGPEGLFMALKQLRSRSQLPPNFKLVLRASGHIDYVESLLAKHGVGQLVELAPQVPHHAALREMLEAEVLVVMQGRTSNPAVPAKVYEYLRAGRPIFGLVHPEGDTAKLLSRISSAFCAPLDDVEGIADALTRLLVAHRRGDICRVGEDELRPFNREYQTAQLAAILEMVVQT